MGEYRWRQLQRYTEAIDALIKRDIEDIPLSTDERLRLETEPFVELELDYSHEEYMERTSVFPEVLRRSAFVTCWILLEDGLIDLAEDARVVCEAHFGVHEIAGRGVRRSVQYLSRLMNHPIDSLPEWPEILHLNELRNVIVHSNGLVKRGRRDSLHRYVVAHPLLGLADAALDGSQVVQVQAGFPTHAAGVAKRLFATWDERLKARRRSAGDLDASRAVGRDT